MSQQQKQCRYQQAHSHRPAMNRMLTQTHRPPKPQPQTSPFIVSQLQQQQKPIIHPLSFKIIKKNKTNHRKRRFIEMIDDKNDNYNCKKRKRRKLNFVEKCSFSYQALINENKWKTKTKLNIKTNDRAPAPKIKQTESDCHPHIYCVNKPQLTNSDKLIQKWDHILCALSFEIIRNMAKNELCSSSNSSLNSKDLQELIANKANKYFLRMNELKINYDSFGKSLLQKGADYWRNCSRLNSLFSYIGCDADTDRNTHFVLNDDIRYNALSIKCEHKLYLWPNGFSYHTMDHLHPYDADAYHTKFIDFIDQCIVPAQWMNDIKRDSFNKKFFKQQQNMRLQRQQHHAQNSNKFNNKLDTFVSAKVIEKVNKNYEEIFKANSYFEGHLFLELIDFRFVYNSNKIDSYQYKQNCKLQRILLKSSQLHLKESFADIPPFYAKHLKSKHFDILHRVYLMKQRKTFEILNKKYSFYASYKIQMKQQYRDLVEQIHAKRVGIQQLYQTYTNYKRTNTFTFEHNLNWYKQNRLLKQLKLCLIQSFYLSYDPLDAYLHRQYQTQYLHLKHNKINLEKKEQENNKNKTKDKGKEKEYLSMIQREQNRIIKLISNPVVRNEIEKQILLKLHNVCLKPSMEVTQVMNYVHYVRDQNLVRSSFNHKQIAKKMKPKAQTQNIYNHHHNKNVIIDGINQSQKFLHFIEQNANEKLFNMLQSMRNETKYLYAKGEEMENEEEPRKHPGQWIPKYSAKHYHTKCCILKKQKYKQEMLIILRIDFMETKNESWLKHNGSWLFTLTYDETQIDYDSNNIDYKYLLNNFNAKNCVHSEECLTLNTAAKIFYEHLRYEIYKNAATLIFSQNTKFDNDTATNHNTDTFEIL